VRVHLVEPGGRGGVYQHTVALATELVEAGIEVHLHTAARAETLPVPAPTPSGGLHRHRCFWGLEGIRPRSARRAAVGLLWLAVGVPSCVRHVRPGDVVHLQGRRLFLVLPVAALVSGRRGCVVAWSPHTTFSRSRRPGRGGQPADDALARWMAGLVDVVLVFSDWDRRRALAWGAVAAQVPFPLPVPRPTPAAVAGWRRRWGPGTGPVVVFAGQLRADKGLDTAVRAAAIWGGRARLAVVGEDLGVLGPARRLARELGVDVAWDEGWRPLESFTAALAAADVVVCPYRQASQSGVLALARALGRPTVAADVGGLAELADTLVPADDPGALARAVLGALADDRRREPPAPVPGWAAAAYVRAYRGLGDRAAAPSRSGAAVTRLGRR
jgi:glycosyltransferase involved in cell wall biosynthesis